MTAQLLGVAAAGLGRALVAAALLAVSTLSGYGLLGRRFRPARAVVAVPLAASTGLLAVGWLSFVAGSLFGTWAVAPVWGAAVAWGARSWRPFGRDVRRVGRRLWLLLRASPPLSAVLGLLLLAFVPQLLLPLVDSDGVRYQVALPKLFLLTGHVFLYPWDIAGAYPLITGMLYLAGTALAGGETAKLLHFLFFLGTLAVLGLTLHASRRTRGVAVLGPLLFAATPVAAASACSAFVDHAALFHLAVALLLLVRRPARGELAGLPLGAALGTKLTVAPAAAGVLALVWLGGSTKRRLREVLGALALVVLSLAPFLVRNALATGDPIFPVGRALLHLPIPGFSEASLRRVNDFRPKLATPLGLAWTPGGAGSGWDDVVGVQHLAGLVATAPALFWAPARPFLALVLPSLAVGLTSHPAVRLLLPLFLGLAAFEALALGRLVRPSLLRACGLVLALPATVWTIQPLLTQFRPFDYVFGRTGREAFLARTVPGYRAVRFVGALPEGAVMALDLPAPYYLDRPWVVEGLLNDPPLSRWLAEGADAEALLGRCRALGVRYLLVTPGYGGGTRISLLPVAPDPSKVPVVAAFRARLKLLATVDGVDVYELPAR